MQWSGIDFLRARSPGHGWSVMLFLVLEPGPALRLRLDEDAFALRGQK